LDNALLESPRETLASQLQFETPNMLDPSSLREASNVDFFGEESTLSRARSLRSSCGPDRRSTRELSTELQKAIDGDIWAMGVTFFYFIYGKPPFEFRSSPAKGEGRWQRYAAFREVVMTERPEWSTLQQEGGVEPPEELKDFIEGLLQVLPLNRYSWNEIFQHQYIRDVEDMHRSVPDVRKDISDGDVKNAVTDIYKVVSIKLIVKKWKRKAEESRLKRIMESGVTNVSMTSTEETSSEPHVSCGATQLEDLDGNHQRKGLSLPPRVRQWFANRKASVAGFAESAHRPLPSGFHVRRFSLRNHRGTDSPPGSHYFSRTSHTTSSTRDGSTTNSPPLG